MFCDNRNIKISNFTNTKFMYNHQIFAVEFNKTIRKFTMKYTIKKIQIT